MLAVPDVMALIRPLAESMLATPVLLLLHTPPVDVVDAVCVLPVHIVPDTLTDAGTASTISDFFTRQPFGAV